MGGRGNVTYQLIFPEKPNTRRVLESGHVAALASKYHFCFIILSFCIFFSKFLLACLLRMTMASQHRFLCMMPERGTASLEVAL